MNSIDMFLASSLSETIIHNLGKKTIQKIEKRIEERYSITFEHAVIDFQKMDATLREFFGSGADAIEKESFGRLISLENSRNNTWIKIENPRLSDMILTSIGDLDKKKILDVSLKQPDIIMSLLKNCKIPQSSGYKIVKELINDGLLSRKGFSISQDGKKVHKYAAMFKNIKMDLDMVKEKNKIRIEVDEDIWNGSFVVHLLQHI